MAARAKTLFETSEALTAAEQEYRDAQKNFDLAVKQRDQGAISKSALMVSITLHVLGLVSYDYKAARSRKQRGDAV